MRRSGLAQSLGILPSYRDVTGAVHDTSVETEEALITAMGADDPGFDQSFARYHVCEAGKSPSFVPRADWHLCLEDGVALEGQGALPFLPMGRHVLHSAGDPIWLIAAPPRLPLPPRDWGMIVPLYGLRRAGIGTYADLGDTAEHLAAKGAGFVGINPVHAGFVGQTELISPYSPSHRRRLNVMHIDVGDPGSATEFIDYSADMPARLAALRTAFDPNEAGFPAWRAAQRQSLERFATYQAISVQHGATWDAWPSQLQDATTAQAAPDEVTFHAWLQWKAELQVMAAQERAKAAGMRHGLYLDLAVGTHPFGAETWEDRHAFASGVSLGAPPDAFSLEGQTWGLAPFNPAHLIRTGFAALAETLRAQLRFAGMLRIDHILGFERAFWVPDGVPGGYVKMPRDGMLAVARIEAARAGAVLIGEDLGNVSAGLRRALAKSGLPGCSVAMFERTDLGLRRAHHYREASIASFSTHDLPTFAGWRAGHDIETRATLGHIDAKTKAREIATRAKDVKQFDALAGGSDVSDMTGFLARSRARLVAIQAEDVLGIIPQPNLPGTVDTYPNWRRRLGIAPDAWRGVDRLTRVAAQMQNAGRNGEG